MRNIAVEVTPVPDADGDRLLEGEKEVPMEFYQSPPFGMVVAHEGVSCVVPRRPVEEHFVPYA